VLSNVPSKNSIRRGIRQVLRVVVRHVLDAEAENAYKTTASTDT